MSIVCMYVCTYTICMFYFKLTLLLPQSHIHIMAITKLNKRTWRTLPLDRPKNRHLSCPFRFTPSNSLLYSVLSLNSKTGLTLESTTDETPANRTRSNPPETRCWHHPLPWLTPCPLPSPSSWVASPIRALDKCLLTSATIHCWTCLKEKQHKEKETGGSLLIGSLTPSL